MKKVVVRAASSFFLIIYLSFIVQKAALAGGRFWKILLMQYGCIDFISKYLIWGALKQSCKFEVFSLD